MSPVVQGLARDIALRNNLEQKGVISTTRIVNMCSSYYCWRISFNLGILLHHRGDEQTTSRTASS